MKIRVIYVQKNDRCRRYRPYGPGRSFERGREDSRMQCITTHRPLIGFKKTDQLAFAYGSHWTPCRLPYMYLSLCLIAKKRFRGKK